MTPHQIVLARQSRRPSHHFSGKEDLLAEATAESLAIDVLPKPFTRQHLAGRLESALERSI